MKPTFIRIFLYLWNASVFFDTTDTISAFLLTFCSAVFEPTESNFRRDLIET